MSLKPGLQAPALSLPLVGGDTWTLSDQRPSTLTMIVVYRGYHCPICAEYLRQLHDLLPKFEEAGVSVIAVSMDPQNRAVNAWDEWQLPNLKIGFRMSEDAARAWGLWLSNSITDKELEVFPEPGVFWIKPDGTVYMAEIASMPFGRADLALLADSAGKIKSYPVRGTH